MASRYVGRKIWLDRLQELTAGRLRDILGATGAGYVMAMGEDVLGHLNTLRPELPTGVRFLFPEQRILQRAFDKAVTLKYAAELGIDHPRTFEPDSLSSVGSGLQGFRYPVVLKFARTTAERLPARMRFAYRYALSRDELIRFLAPYEPYRIFPLIQEYIPGKGVGVELCMHGATVAAAFQHERIHELPIAGGPGVYRRSVPLSEDLLDRAVTLLRAMEWQGVAMVEFRRDPATGRASLMEVNGRFWGSLPLAVKAGVNFPHVLYRTMGEGCDVRPEPYRTDVRVKQFGTHLKWFWEAFVARSVLPPEGFMPRWRVLAEFLTSFGPRVRYDIETWDDPRPAVEYWMTRLRALKGLVPATARRAGPKVS
jgi:predicted ATP-grasp superfamily ATP-dependent carboligase